MIGYSTGEVAQMLHLAPARIRGFVRSGFLRPSRGPRGSYRFSFQDLVLLRTAEGLRAAGISSRRIRGALSRLRWRLPEGHPLSALHITADGERVVVRDGATLWQPESGQTLFDFAVGEIAEKAAPLARRAFQEAERDAAALSAEDWYAWGYELEPGAPEQARQAYERALAIDPKHGPALVNLGRLLHEAGELAAAAEHYRRALDSEPADATAAFNLGVVLEDLGRRDLARTAYERAVELDPNYADAHYNLGCLYENAGEVQAALRHLKTYRNLTRGGK